MRAALSTPSRTSRFFVPPQCHLLNYSYVTSIVKENVIFVSFFLPCEISCCFYTLFFFVLLPFVFAVWPFACVSFSAPRTAFGIPLPRAAYRAGAGAALFLLQSAPLFALFRTKNAVRFIRFLVHSANYWLCFGLFYSSFIFWGISFCYNTFSHFIFLSDWAAPAREEQHYATTFHHF